MPILNGRQSLKTLQSYCLTGRGRLVGIRIWPSALAQGLILTMLFGLSLVSVGGARGRPLEGGLVKSIAIDPTTPDTIYVGTLGGGVFKSTDGGVSFVSSSVGLTGNAILALVIDPGNSSHLWAGVHSTIEGRGVGHSLDGGNSWSMLNAGLADLSVVGFVFDQAGNIYAKTDESMGGNQGRFYRLTGEVWQEVQVTSPAYFGAFQASPMAMASAGGTEGLFAVAGGDFLRSSDGTTWETISNVFANQAYSLAMDPGNKDVVYTGTLNEVMKSINGGTTWTAVGPPGFLVRSLALAPTDPNTIYVGSLNGSVFKSQAGGGDFVDTTAGTPLETLDILSLAVSPVDASTVFAGTFGGGLFKSTNGGSSWAASSTGIWAVVSGLGFDGTAAGGGIPPLYAGTVGQGVFKSLDRGQTWTDANGDLPTGFPRRVFSLLVHPSVANTVYIGTDSNGVYRTSDGGQTWVRLGSAALGVVLELLFLDPGPPAKLITASMWGRIASFTEGDADWTIAQRFSVTFDATGLVVDPSNPLVLFAGNLSSNSIIKSTDGGLNWVELTPTGLPQGGVLSLLAQPAARGTILLAGTSGNGLYRSTDGGLTWQAAGSGLPSEGIFTMVADPGNSSVLFAGTESKGVYMSGDGGVSWAPLQSSSGSITRSMSFEPQNPGVIFAGTGWGVVETSTTPLATPTPTGQLVDTPTETATPAATGSPTVTPVSVGAPGGSSQGLGILWFVLALVLVLAGKRGFSLAGKDETGS